MRRVRFGNYHESAPLEHGRRWTTDERLADMAAIAERIEGNVHSRADLHQLRQHFDALKRNDPDAARIYAELVAAGDTLP